MKKSEGALCPHCKSTDTSPENREKTNHYCYACRRFFRIKEKH